mgnify:CR=1 FL=1
MKTWQKWLGGVVLGSAGFVGFVGFLHTPAGRPLLSWVGKQAGCPVSFDGADPKAVEAYRVKQLEKRVGKTATERRPAFAFELGSSRSTVENWLATRHVECTTKRQDSVIQCARYEVEGQPIVSELHLQFDGQARLVAVDLFRETGCGQVALRHLQQVSGDLTREVGPVTKKFGVESARDLDAARFHRVEHRFEYADYVAELGAMNYGSRGVRVRERYQWLPADAASTKS